MNRPGENGDDIDGIARSGVDDEVEGRGRRGEVRIGGRSSGVGSFGDGLLRRQNRLVWLGWWVLVLVWSGLMSEWMVVREEGGGAPEQIGREAESSGPRFLLSLLSELCCA